MRKLNLMLHCGAKSADRAEIANVELPEATESYHPIPHNTLANMLTDRLPELGMEVVQEAHGLFKGGDRYFGMFQVAPKAIGGDGASASENDMGLVFGLRNSHDKCFPAGLCLGSGVFVCDNLAFSAEIVIGRRHTRHIMRDLPLLVSTAMGKLMDAKLTQEQRFDKYKTTEIGNAQAHDIVCRALRDGAINATRVPKVLNQWYDPAHPEFKERNAWSLFNGFTEVYKGSSLVELPNRTTRLHGILDSACGLQTVAAAKTDLQGAFAGPDVTVN